MSEKMTAQEVIGNYQAMQLHAEMEQKLREMKEEHKTASRGEKMKLTRQINELQDKADRLKETFKYVRIITAKRVVERIVDQLEKIQNDYKEAVAKFVERFEYDPEDAIAWKGNYVVALKIQNQYAKTLVNAMNECTNEDDMVDEYIRVYNYLKKEATNQIMMNARRGSSRSTSQFHNVVEQAKMEGMAEFFDNWQLGEAEYHLDMINNYRILKEAGLLTEK